LQSIIKKAENAKIALIDAALEVKSTETDAKIEITSPEQMQAFLDQEESMLRKMVETWLTTEFSGGRHQRRVNKIRIIEEGGDPSQVKDS